MENENSKNKIGRPPGTPKTGGRKKGTPNKITKAVRAQLVKIINRNVRNIQTDLDSLEPKDRLTILEKLMQYVVPKQSAIKAEISDLSPDEVDAVAAQLLDSLNQCDDE